MVAPHHIWFAEGCAILSANQMRRATTLTRALLAMKSNQRNQGKYKRLMYVENEDGLIDGKQARIGWVSFSKTGKSIYYRGRTLLSLPGGGVKGNFMDEDTREEYWVSGVKVRGSNTHYAEHVKVAVDEDALEEYKKIRASE